MAEPCSGPNGASTPNRAESEFARKRSSGVKWIAVGSTSGLTLLVLGMCIDVVHTEGDHTSFLVLAPYPTPGFVHGGGEEGAWRRAHPTGPEPWWLAGRYLVIREL